MSCLRQLLYYVLRVEDKISISNTLTIVSRTDQPFQTQAALVIRGSNAVAP
jgi:hypothetical protein